MEIKCSIAGATAVLAEQYTFVFGGPEIVHVEGQQMYLLYVERSDGVRLKAYGFDLLDVYESALMVVRLNAETTARRAGSPGTPFVHWH